MGSSPKGRTWPSLARREAVPADKPVALEPRERHGEVMVAAAFEERLQLGVAARAAHELEQDAAPEVAFLRDNLVGEPEVNGFVDGRSHLGLHLTQSLLCFHI